MYGLVLLLLSIVPTDGFARESVDLIELNHFYDEHGRLVFDQVIFYDWSSSEARYNVRAWRLVKNPNQLPVQEWIKDAITGTSKRTYVCTWQDGEQARQIHSPATRETWTQYDPELVEREYLPKEKRKELRTVSVKKPKKTANPAAAAISNQPTHNANGQPIPQPPNPNGEIDHCPCPDQ